MFIYYMTKPNEVFSPQAQALDLCIRLIACPIFSLPPPRILLRHYKDKYGSGARDDNNLNTMIEDGITNDPRPRRPAMLIAQPSFPSARHSDYIFHPPHHHPTSFLVTRPSEEFYATREMEEKHLSTKRSMEGDSHNAGGTTSSSEATVTETNNNSNVTSSGGDRSAGDDPTASLFITSDLPPTATTSTTKENKSYPVVGMDEAVLSNLSISNQSVDFQTTPSAKNNSNNSNNSAATTPAQHLPSPLTSSFFHLNNNSNINSKRDEDDETAVAARRISRRLTMEGRRDGLDFLNIAGRIKWPHRSGGGDQSSASNSSTHLPSTTSMVFTPTTTVPKSSLAIKPSQSFPPMALNRAGPSGPSSSSISISAGIEKNHGMVVRGGGGIGGGGNRKERLSVISSMLEADGVLSHDNDDYEDDSHHSQRRESFHELSEKPSSSTMATATHNNNINYSSSTNSTIRPPSPSVDPSNSTPTPSHISTGLKAMDMDIGMDTSIDMVKIRRQSRDILTRLHGDSLAAPVVNAAMVQGGPHSPTILRTGLTPRAKQDSEILGRSSSSSSSSTAPSSPTSAESITTTTTLPFSSASP
ncbi:MAG: hypothetical protein J3R72DRAFT_184153 [Linnemannia gamsii]|nr:MAG: hypothetical protein J3R72DRAFT_184153 [Linnemannia gamsii]